MSRSKRILQNSAILTTQTIVLNVISIVVIGYIARRLGQQDYGIYSLAFSFPTIFEIIGHLGLRTLTVREVSRTRDNSFEYLGKIVPARIILIGVMGLTVVLSAYLMNYDERVIISILIALVSSLFDQMSRIILDIFQAFEEMGRVAVRDVLIRLFTACSCVLVLLLGYGLYEICFVYTIGSFLGLLINIVLYLKRFPLPHLYFDFDFILFNLKEGFSFVIIGFLCVLITKSDIVILSKLTDNSTVGVYNASANLYYRLNLLADNISMAVFPAISELFWKDIKEAESIFNKSFIIMLLIALPMGFGGLVLSDQIIGLIYGSGYHESVSIFRIMILSLPFMYLWTLLFYSLGAINQQKYVAKVLFLNAAIYIAGNLLLINWFGAKGAAITMLITQLLCFILLFYRFRKYLSIGINLKKVVLISSSLLCMVIVALWTRSYGIYVALPLAAMSYLLSLYLLGRNEFNFHQLLKLKQ